MKHPILVSSLLTVAIAAALPAAASKGGLDKNGCHYDSGTGQYHCHRSVPPNSELNAPVKKSRENVCHDDRSPNYRTLRYFISYYSMNECVASGGVEYRH